MHVFMFADKELQEKGMALSLEPKARIDLGRKNPSMRTLFLNVSAALNTIDKNILQFKFLSVKFLVTILSFLSRREGHYVDNL